MPESGGRQDTHGGPNDTAVIEKIAQLDRSLQAWTNERLSSDLFLGRMVGYLVKVPVELSLAGMISGIFVGVGSIAAIKGFTYPVTTTQVVTPFVALSVGIYSKTAHCSLSEEETSPVDRESTIDKENEEENEERDKSDSPPELEV